jgi:hypothetical protein
LDLQQIKLFLNNPKLFESALLPENAALRDTIETFCLNWQTKKSTFEKQITFFEQEFVDHRSVDDHYDEIYLNGVVRPHYRNVMSIIEKIEREQPTRIDSFEAFSMKVFILPFKLNIFKMHLRSQLIRNFMVTINFIIFLDSFVNQNTNFCFEELIKELGIISLFISDRI